MRLSDLQSLAGEALLLVRRLGSHRGGNFALMLAVTAPVLMLAVGYSVNVSQLSHTRSILSSALDAAVTSTARDLTTGSIAIEDAPKIVEAFLIANGPDRFTSKVTLEEVRVDRLLKTVSARASAEFEVSAVSTHGTDLRL